MQHKAYPQFYTEIYTNNSRMRLGTSYNEYLAGIPPNYKQLSRNSWRRLQSSHILILITAFHSIFSGWTKMVITLNYRR